MGANTREEKIYLILKTIENHEGIGPSQLQIKTQIPKKTLYKYLDELEKDKVITKKKTGNKSNSRVSYTVNFSDDLKNAIKHNLGQILKYHKWYTGTKYRKLNTFPHYLQELAAEYYQNMMSLLFDGVPAYKYGVKRLEEILLEEKKRLDKEFNRKDKLRLWVACQEVQFYLSGNGSDSIYHAADRNNLRTKDEILIDCVNPSPLNFGTQEERLKKVKAQVISTATLTVDKYRVDFIKDEKIKKLFIELADEYDQLSQRLRTIKYRLAGITGSCPFEPPNAESWDDI